MVSSCSVLLPYSALCPSLLLHFQLAALLSELDVTWLLSKPPGSSPTSCFPLLGTSQVPFLSSSPSLAAKCPLFYFSLGPTQRLEKSRKIVHFLNRSCFEFSHSCCVFQKWEGSQDRWLSSDYFKPQSHKNRSKITPSSRGQMQNRAAGFRESLIPTSLESQDESTVVLAG